MFEEYTASTVDQTLAKGDLLLLSLLLFSLLIVTVVVAVLLRLKRKKNLYSYGYSDTYNNCDV